MSNVVVVGRHAAAGSPIVAASFADGIFVATATADENEDPEGALVFCCPACFVADRPEAAFILQAAKARGCWHAE